MKILMINKFLYPNGGSETYIFKLGEELVRQGHEVEYFGMEHKGRCVGNRVNAYTSDMDFHNGSKLFKLTYPIKTIYSKEAKIQIRKVLDDFKPDVCHLNNFNYQLTPSIILEIVKWRRESNHPCKIVYTAHDYQLVCPNHMLHNPNAHTNCEKCLNGSFLNCVKGKCIHGSTAKSLVGSFEAIYWNLRGTYKYIDSIICPSNFMKAKLDTNPIFKDKTIAMHNFIDKVENKEVKKKDYVLYFGRYSEEKGINTMLNACMQLPNVRFVFAGSGPLDHKVNSLSNVENVGFKTGEELDNLIREAKLSICPSEIYENCPFSVMESQQRGTTVIGANIGGIPELIDDKKDGELFKALDTKELANLIKDLLDNPNRIDEYAAECLKIKRDDLNKYSNKLVSIYRGGQLVLSCFYKPQYVLYFGRYSEEKGIKTLIEACKKLQNIQFVFAGNGPLENEVNSNANIKNVGFKKGNELINLIHEAKFSIYPSEWYENCPFSIMESISYETPVLGSYIGGIPELVEDNITGMLFESKNAEELKSKIIKLYKDEELLNKLTCSCREYKFESSKEYAKRLIEIFKM